MSELDDLEALAIEQPKGFGHEAKGGRRGMRTFDLHRKAMSASTRFALSKARRKPTKVTLAPVGNGA